MKTKFTLVKAITFGIIISSALLLASCSTSNQLSSQNPHYHLTLVKADTPPLPANKKVNEPTASIIEPLSTHPSFASANSDETTRELSSLLNTDLKIYKNQAKKSDPKLFHQLKSINANTIFHQLINHSSKYSDNTATHTNSSGNSGSYLILWIVFLLLAILFYILSIGASIFFIFGLLCDLAAVIFFILWIVSFLS